MEKSYKYLKKCQRISSAATCSGLSCVSLFDEPMAACAFFFSSKDRGLFWMSESCPVLTSWKQERSSEVIHKSNDPRRRDKRSQLQLRNILNLTKGIRGFGEIRLRIWLSPQFLSEQRDSVQETIKTIHTEAWCLCLCLCAQDTNRERTGVQRFVVRLWWVKRLYNG